ncbi:2-polyprenyl-6-methoxyphenol hydroxylase-like oxidoreductase [Pseudarthrobacter phenanthrenivorans Sphe3]|uniref:2-polyprenyl-6-methoxyphenol hydroxylase-like oxidoreductase n=1 Tax=Pseudarthrobacter phenanthrenivorans (strain DSM 18606 / JCM 16027 / LMG 23796 / Sphe3) TaxID=930171 RepID=F0M270_PSEPM|nr:FAD-dependent monooxygenase [Pseudarthrobacter phenanthrenivorans]ADX74273.1 2-polyprenyl-6-methoxyphenol hydroxylase-like oxidoreductase [Pseudarthrobacter phenanthrenivorans Sphe3]
MSAQSDILVVGAGPAGLATALQAHAHGATVRIVDRRSERVRPSRALMLHARALEGLRPLGVTDELLNRADTTPEARIHLGKRVVQAKLGHADLPDTAFPHLTLVRQADVEDVLWHALQARDVPVDWGVEFRGLEGHGRDGASGRDGGVRAELALAGTDPGHTRTDRRLEQHECRYLAGCDGQSSIARGLVGAEWRGAPYRVEAVLADLELDGPLDPGLLHAAVAGPGLVFLFALGEGATWRMLATRPAGPHPAGPFGQLGPAVPWKDVAELVDGSGLGATVREVRWSAQVPLQHRLASRFRSGPLFLAGDAAHAHSPAGGQGMNNGILDGLNLGWKLGLASAGGEHRELLDSYDHERRLAARRVLALTHVIFFGEASPHPLARLLRSVLPLSAPLLPVLLRQRRLTAVGIRLLAQPFVRYRQSPISLEGTPPAAGWPRPGDRLPDAAAAVEGGQCTRLHELTATPGLHVFVERDAGWDTLGAGPAFSSSRVHVHRLTSHPGRGIVGVRPDGHVGFRCGEADLQQLGAWLRLAGAVGDWRA